MIQRSLRCVPLEWYRTRHASTALQPADMGPWRSLYKHFLHLSFRTSLAQPSSILATLLIRPY
jgi:hypothetical protein